MDDKLDELVKDLNRTKNNLSECDGATFQICLLEWQAAAERLNLYFKERKMKDVKPIS